MSDQKQSKAETIFPKPSPRPYKEERQKMPQTSEIE